MDVCQVHTTVHIPFSACARRPRLRRSSRRQAQGAASARDALSVSTSDYQTLAQLLLASAASSPDALKAAVAERRQQLTTPFLSWLSDQASGSGPDAVELDRLGARVAALCDTLDGSAFAEELSAAARGQLQALGSLSAQSGGDATSLVGDVNVEHLQQRWAALAVWGVDNAPGQAAANADARRNSATELLGRVPLSATQTATVTAQLPEDRILAVLLSIPDGMDRVAAVDDALTPPSGDVPSAAQVPGNMPLGDEMLFTTPPRLLAAIDRALVGALMRSSETGRREGKPLLGGQVTGTVAALQQLRDAVLQRLTQV